MPPPPPPPETILITTPNSPITAYDPYTGTILARFTGTQCPRNGITLLGDNQFACSHVSPETGAGSIHLYYWWSPSYTQNIPLPEPVAPIASTSDGSYLFSGGISGDIHSLSIPSGDLIRSFSAHEKPVSCITISSDGSLILSGSDDGTIAVTPVLMLLDSGIDTQSKFSKFRKFAGHESPVTGITTGVGRSDGIIISSSLDWTCKVWSVVTGIHLHTVSFAGEIWSMALDPSETELYAAGADGLVYKRKLKVERRKEVVEGGDVVVWGGVHGGGVVGVVMLNYGNALLTVCENGGAYVWEVGSGRMVSSFGEKSGGLSGVVVVRCGGGFGRRVVGNGESGGYGSGREVGKMVKDVAEDLKVAVEERGRAIGDFESAIEVNEKLLNLMLEEAGTISKLESLTLCSRV